MQGASKNVYKRLWYALINFSRFRSIVPPKLEVGEIQKGRYWPYLAQEGLGYSNPRTHSSTVPSRDNHLSTIVRDGYGEVIRPLKKMRE